MFSLKKIILIDNKNIFEDVSDDYVKINLRRKKKELLIFTYKYEELGYYIYIGIDGRINGIEVLNKPEEIFLENEEEIMSKPKIKGECYIKIPTFDKRKYEMKSEVIKGKIIFRKLENEGYILFDTNSNIEYILELDKNFKVLIHKNNKICGIINYNFQEILNEIKRNKF